MLTKKSFGPYFVAYSWKVPGTKEVQLYRDRRGKGHDDCERTDTLQTHDCDSPGRIGWRIWVWSSFNFTYLLRARELLLFFFLTAYTLLLSRVLNVCQLPSVFFWCLHADTLSPILTMSFTLRSFYPHSIRPPGSWHGSTSWQWWTYPDII